jgi:hypothetical protein
MSEPSSYAHDYDLWFADQAGLLRAGTWQQIDVEHLGEALEDIGKREKRALRRRAVLLLAHLLKYKVQPEHRIPSWHGRIREQRKQMGELLSDSPSHRNRLVDDLQDSYVSARLLAAGETGLCETAFPENCPFSIDQILDEGFWPHSA